MGETVRSSAVRRGQIPLSKSLGSRGEYGSHEAGIESLPVFLPDFTASPRLSNGVLPLQIEEKELGIIYLDSGDVSNLKGRDPRSWTVVNKLSCKTKNILKYYI
jgi:hypothetical protein